MSEKDYIRKGNKWLGKVKTWVDEHGGEPIVPFCGALENKFVGMSPEDQKKYADDNKASSAIPKIIKTGYSALELIHFFTCGTDEVKCWTIRVLLSSIVASVSSLDSFKFRKEQKHLKQQESFTLTL